MPKQHITRSLPFSAGQMFDLVADVERYAEFVPGCRSVTVHARRAEGAREVLVADMRVGHRLIEESVPCEVRLDRAALTIAVRNSGGPLSHLANDWAFRDLAGGGSEVEFDIDFALRSRALGFVVGRLFDRVFLHLVEAFEARARSVYGDAG